MATISRNIEAGQGTAEAGGLASNGDKAAATSPRTVRQPVALRLELATKLEAKITQYSTWALSFLLVVLSIALIANAGNLKGDYGVPFSMQYHRGMVIVAGIQLGILVGVGALFVKRVRQSHKNHLVWTRKQKILAIDAGVVLSLVTVCTIFWLVPNIVVLRSTCSWPYKTAAAMALVRDMFFITLMMWLVITMSGMTIYRGNALQAATAAAHSAAAVAQTAATAAQSAAAVVVPGIKPAGDDSKGGKEEESSEQLTKLAQLRLLDTGLEGRLLVMDQPWRKQFRIHALQIAVWLAFVLLSLAPNIKELLWDGTIPMGPECAVASLDSLDAATACGNSTTERVSSAIEAVVVIAYLVAYIVYQRRAFRDHQSLPYCKYRLSNLYIRVQARHTSVTLVAVVLSLLVGRIAASSGSCWVHLENQLGSLPVHLSMGLLALVCAVLYIPVGGFGGATVLQAWLQEFSWSEAALPAARADRAQRLRALAEAEVETDLLVKGARKMLHAIDVLRVLPNREEAVDEAAAALEKEPMLCIETACRMFTWSRLAYQVNTPNPMVTAETALGLVGLQQYEVLCEPTTETQAVIAWAGPGNPNLVLSFRGTANMKNAVTDIKFFKTPHLPKRRYHGGTPQVHVGFYSAFLGNGFKERMMARLEEIIGGLQVDASQLRIFVTGHSLGGALATLAAFEVKCKWPEATMTVYTFGAPRVGNVAFSSEYNEALPDTWAFISANDPVPRIPKGFYKRNGQRVTVNTQGDILVRPSFFELSIINKTGGTVTDHMTGQYALALAAIMKAQFSPNKSLPGGEAGVREMAASLDIGRALVLQHMDVEDLSNPELQPCPVGEEVKKKRRRRQLKDALLGLCGGTDASSGVINEDGFEVASPQSSPSKSVDSTGA